MNDVWNLGVLVLQLLSCSSHQEHDYLTALNGTQSGFVLPPRLSIVATVVCCCLGVACCACCATATQSSSQRGYVVAPSYSQMP